MSQDKIKSAIDDYARTKGLKLTKLREAIHVELEDVKRVVVNEASKGED